LLEKINANWLEEDRARLLEMKKEGDEYNYTIEFDYPNLKRIN